MKHAKIPFVTAGGDWAGAMNIHAGQIGSGVAHHGVEQTRARLRLASIMFVLVFAVLGGVLHSSHWPKTRNWRASAWPTVRPRFSVPQLRTATAWCWPRKSI